MSSPETMAVHRFSEEERVYLRKLVLKDFHKFNTYQQKLRMKLGDDYDQSWATDIRRNMETVYAELGGNPKDFDRPKHPKRHA